MVAIRIATETIAEIDKWAALQFTPLSRSEAIRLLIEIGFESLKRKKN